MDRGVSAEDGSIRLPVDELRRLSENFGSATIFEPQSAARAPEKKLTLFALRVAIFEKAATGLGALGFIWATVVLLGGFAITLDKTDFWFITIILLIEGTRICSRSHELEWQHQATWSIADAGIKSFRALRSSPHFIVEIVKTLSGSITRVRKQSPHSRETRESPAAASSGSGDGGRNLCRTWTSSDVPILPYAQWFFLSGNVSKLLYWLQLASASACVVLSLMKLIRQNYGEIEKGDTDRRNRKAALIIFYSLALAEALLFLMEKAYWEWKLSYCKLLEEVRKECDLGLSGLVSIRRFFYDAYSRCVEGSIFDGLKMDMVTFAMELLASNSADEQIIGARVLCQFTMNPRFSDDTLQKIGTNIPVIERLVEILNWKDPQEEEIRRSAAEILSKLAGKKQNSLRVAGIPGALESISSLLHTSRTFSTTADEIGEKTITCDHAHYGFWTFNQLGLLILKKLARDLDNCGKIGNTRGLLPKIIDFMHAEERWLKDENVTPYQILTVKRSLQLGLQGSHLRREISEMVFTISNIRDILRHGDKHPRLQKLGIEILTSLALEEDATERIGGAGGVLKELLNIFFSQRIPENQNHVRIAAGEALAMLALESRRNCLRILKLRVLERLVGALEVPLLRVNAARILRNLCAYSGADCFDQLKGITATVPTVLKAVMSEESKLQEVMVGLAAEAFKFMTCQESNTMFNRAGIEEAELANNILQISKKNPRQKLKASTYSPALCGLSRHSTTIHSLVETAMQLLEDR
ncbi:hypothetical protein OIU85_005297 [Salix viminalis]|uniref:ARM repeat superfamily protein n=1 Tax=Salix viminalis TaxID=40686 RepID=A0A9Q0PIQ3_SALVM|nr:hypothetical protein OIU85_005297 [Salix viminalis]